MLKYLFGDEAIALKRGGNLDEVGKSSNDTIIQNSFILKCKNPRIQGQWRKKPVLD
jgi:hypothetical protein